MTGAVGFCQGAGATMRSYRVGDEPIPGYKLLKKLGSGGFGEVWKASAPGGAELALKIVGLQRKQGYKEFRALNLIKFIHHPNLTPVHAFWLKDEDGYVLDAADPTREALLMPPGQKASIRSTMVVESPAGQPSELIIAMGLGSMSLYDRLMQCRSQGMPGIPAGELLEYMEDAAKAIDFLNSPVHDMGSGPTAIQHCDIKPQNILLVGNAAQVCDFGLARGINDIRTSGAAGSPAYSAPECISANKPSPQTDQYSFAISYYELRTGELPFEDDSSYMAVATAHLNGRLVLTGLPEDERKVIQRATALNPADRFETTTKMVRALRRACPEAEDSSVIPPPPTSEMDVGNGYRLVEPLVRSSGEEIWAAVAPGGKKVAVLVRALKDPVTAVDQQALCLTRDMRHQRLAEIHGWWFLDTGGRVIPDNMRGSPGSATPNKLVMVGKLAAGNLVHRLQECRDDTGGGIPPAELLRYMEQLAEAVDYLNAPKHSIGGRTVSIQHCNLRPSNFLIDDAGLRLGNFALAKALPGASISVDHETFGAESPYVAPEVLQGRLTTTSDQFVLAVNYVHLRTGKLPFDAAGSTRRIIEQQRDGMDLSSLTFVEAEAVRRATSEDPQARYQNCKAFVAAIRAALQPTGALSDSRMTEDFRQVDGSSGAGGRTGVEEREDVVATMAPPITETPSAVRDTIQTPSRPSPAAQEIEEVLRRPGSIPPKKGRARRRLAALGLLLLVCGGSAAALYVALKPAPSSVEPDVLALVKQTEFRAAFEKVEASIPPLTDSEGDRLKNLVLSAWCAHLEGLLNMAESETPAQQLQSVETVERDSGTILQLAPSYAAADTLFAKAVAMKDTAASAAVGATLTAANELLAANQLPQAAERFGQVISAGSARGTLFETQARLGRARANARLRAWRDLQQDLEALGRMKDLGAANRPVLESLQAIAAANSSPLNNLNVLQALKPLYRDGKLLSQYGTLPEAKQLEEEKQKALDRTLALAVIPDDQRELAANIHPGLFDVEPFLQQAEKHLSDKKFVQAHETLADAVKRVGSSSEHPRLTALRWRIDLEDPNSDVGSTAAAISESIDEHKFPAQLDKIAMALASRAAVNADIRPVALKVLARASDYALDEQLVELQRMRFALVKESLWERLADSKGPNFEGLLDECYSLGKEAEADPLVALILAECLLETSRDKLQYDTIMRLNRYVSNEAAIEDQRFLPYAHYVRSTVLWALPRTYRAKAVGELDKLVPLLSVSSPAPVLQVTHRKRNAAQVLVEAAADLRAPFDPQSVDSVLANPFGDQKQAEQAYQWLHTAGTLLAKDEKPADLLPNYVLAAFHRPKQELDQLRSAMAGLTPSIDKLPPDQRLPILLVRSRMAKDPGSQAAAVSSAVALGEMWRDADLLDNSQAVRLVAEVLERVIRGAVNVPAETTEIKQSLAKLHALKGRLMRSHKFADWSSIASDRSQATLDAYVRAIELDSSRPEYLVGRGKAYLELAEPDLANAVKDATAALSLNKQMAAAYGLRGHCLIKQAVQETSLETRQKSLEQAIADLKIAVDDPAADKSDLAIHHINASVASVLLASSIRDPTLKRQEDLLLGAVQHAEDALALDNRYPEFAYHSMGNAYEDLAWMLSRSKPEMLKYYDDAIEAFHGATSADPADPDHYLARARCNWKRVVFGRQNTRYLSDSEKDLALLLNDEKTKKLPELHYWLGNLYSAQKRFREADASFAKAVEYEGQQGASSTLYAYTRAQNAVANTLLQDRDRAEQIRRCADELAECKPGEGIYSDPIGFAAYFHGKAYEAEGKTAEALRSYADGEKAAEGYAREQLLDSAAAIRLRTREFAAAKKDGLAIAEIAQGSDMKAKGFAYAGQAEYAVATAAAGGDLEAMRSAKDYLEQSIALDPGLNSVPQRETLLKAIAFMVKHAQVGPGERLQLARTAINVIDGGMPLADKAGRETLAKLRVTFSQLLQAQPANNGAQAPRKAAPQNRPAPPKAPRK